MGGAISLRSRAPNGQALLWGCFPEKITSDMKFRQDSMQVAPYKSKPHWRPLAMIGSAPRDFHDPSSGDPGIELARFAGTGRIS